MKTLDEVIDYCEGKQTCGEWVGIADALYYLKEYQKKGYSWLKEEMRLRKAIDSLLVSLETIKCILHGDDDEDAG